VTKEIEAFITEKVTPQVTKEVEAFLHKVAEEDGLKYEGEHLKELEAEGFAYVKKEIETHVGELFGQILTNVTGIVTELKAAAPKAKIDYVGLYDPYGSLLKEGEELKPGFKALAELFNTEAKGLITAKKGFKGCFTDPATIFNPGGAKEPEALQKFTNMANAEEFEGKKDGPDIHPTPLGYEEMAKQLETECKF
jgi:lysophospholipase L1-like esterase